MKYIIGKNRSQLEMFCLDEHIAKDNEVRVIELFVDSLALADYGFVEREANPLGGKPAYHPSYRTLGLCPFAGKEQATNERTLRSLPKKTSYRRASIWNH